MVYYTLSSPRSWGCFRCFRPLLQNSTSLPHARGGVSTDASDSCAPFSLPHARGGVSKRSFPTYRVSESSPRSWGCFHVAHISNRAYIVFPTLVGVFLVGSGWLMSAPGLPHARGGVSNTRIVRQRQGLSSPRSWGCFYTARHLLQLKDVFPTLVGVFHRPLLIM